MASMSLKRAAACLKEFVLADIPVMLSGAPGLGKSESVYQVGAEIAHPIIDLRVSRMDPVDLHGMPVPDLKSKTTIWLTPSMLPTVAKNGPKGILFLDELNTASQAMQTACYGLILERRLGDYTLPQGWVPIAAGNRMSDRASAQRMPTALRNRFAHLEIDFDLTSWCDWAVTHDVNPMVIAFARFRPELMHKMPSGDENCFPTPRGWAKVSKVANAGVDIRQHLVAAIVGDGPASEFEGFARLFASLPSIQKIIDDPEHAKVPSDSEPALLYAVSSALARRATKETLGAILIYAGRLPKEFEVFIAVDAVKRDAALTKNRSFTQWAIRNQEVTL